jgi:hypothetical protein
MQLTPPRRRHDLFQLLLCIATVLIVATVRVQVAAGADVEHPPAERTAHGELEDATTKRASMEIATYADTDHVTVFTPSLAVGIENVSGASLHASYLVDVVSAASADIVSTASRRWTEVRQAGSLVGQYKPHDFGVSVGTSVSTEPDYLSEGAFATVTKDFDEKNWTLVFGYGFSHDIIGRSGTPFSVFSRELQRGAFNGGVTFVVDKATVASVGGDLVIENGDQSKPYRYIPMFSPQEAAQVQKGASIDFVNANRLPERPLEQLPLERRRFALTGRYAHRFDGSTVRLEQRFYYDNWALFASSSDARWVFDLGKRFALWPHARLHIQSGVSFWQLAYQSRSTTGWDLPEFRTGDRELGPLFTATGGAGLKWYIGDAAEPRKWSVTAQADAMHTSFFDALYLTDRSGFIGSATLEGEF